MNVEHLHKYMTKNGDECAVFTVHVILQIYSSYI